MFSPSITMKTLTTFLYPAGWLFVATLLLGAGCNRIQQDPDPAPTPLPAELAVVVRAGLTSGKTVSFDTDSLVPRPGKAYTFRFSQPVFGQLARQGSQLTYTPPPATVVWFKDSARYTVCQDGSCGSGWLRMEKVPDPAACLPDADQVLLVSALGQRTFTFPTGAQLNLFTAENYTVDTLNGQTLRYQASGSIYNFGYDLITYRYQLGGNCHEGRVLVFVGDSCLAGARKGSFAAPGNERFISETELLPYAKGCRNQIADGSFSTKPTSTGRVATRFGTLADTTVSGTKGLYYVRRQPGTEADSVLYYYTSGDGEERITRATLTLTP